MEDFAALEMRGGTQLALRHDPKYRAPGPAGWDLMVDHLEAVHNEWYAQVIPVTDIVDGPPRRSFELTDPDGHVIVVRDTHAIGPV